jgi:hypothetical protein
MLSDFEIEIQSIGNYSTIRVEGKMLDIDGTSGGYLTTGFYRPVTNTAINAFKLYASGTSINAGKVSLYGIKG